MAKKIVPQLKKHHRVVRGWLGVMIQEVTPQIAQALGLKEPYGALITDVTPNSPAEKAGLKRGDVIIEYDGHPIEEMNELPRLVAVTPVGEKVKIKVWREGKKKTFTVTIGELKEEMAEKQMVAPTGYNLGIEVTEITPSIAARVGIDKGVVISRVRPGSLAYEAGLRRGDVILEINRRPIIKLDDYYQAIKRLKPGESVLFLVKRQEGTLFIPLQIPKGE